MPSVAFQKTSVFGIRRASSCEYFYSFVNRNRTEFLKTVLTFPEVRVRVRVDCKGERFIKTYLMLQKLFFFSPERSI